MKPIILLTLAILILFSGCKKKEEEIVPEPTGSINVKVIKENGIAAKNANVYIPETNISGLSDDEGMIVFENINVGITTIAASIGNYGSGNSKISILADTIIQTEIKIVHGLLDSISPIIRVISPVDQLTYYHKDTVHFSAFITDDNTKAEDMIIKWESSIDGILNTDTPNPDGLCSFSINNLSRASHLITLTVTDTSGFISTAEISLSMLLPGPVILKEVRKDNKHIKISWSKYADDDFATYELYRSVNECLNQTQELLGTFDNMNDTIFYDKTPPIEYKACYVIRVTNTFNRSRLSNSLSIDLPAGVVFDFIPDDIIKNPNENIVYLISFDNKKIIKYNYLNNEIEKELILPDKPGYCDLGDNGNGLELYVPCKNGRIFIYNPDDLSLIKSITTYSETLSAVIDGNGNIIASLLINGWNDGPVRTYSRNSGSNIDFSEGHIGCRLRRIPGKNEVIAIADNYIPAAMERFVIGTDGKFTDYIEDNYHGEYPMSAKIFRVSDYGEYLITYYDGSIYFTDENMTYMGSLNNGEFEFLDFAFNDNDNIIYAAPYDKRIIKIANYPSLLIDDEISLIGFPKKIITNGNKLIVSIVSSVTGAEKSAIEIIDIP